MDVVDAARLAYDTGPVCLACVGRTLADRSHGFTNRRRGEAVTDALALADDIERADLEVDEVCWVCEDVCSRYDEFAELVVEAIGDIDFETYQVGTRIPAFLAENDRLLREDVRGDHDAGESLKRACNREIGKRVGRLTGAEVDFGRPDLVAVVDIEDETVDLTVNSVFVYGRYRKLERGIPQTEWPCTDCNATGRVHGEACEGCDGTGYRYDRSVEQLTAPTIRDAFGGSEATFHGAGREDIDAKMLGPGRPFVVEVFEPQRRRVNIDELEAAVNEAADGAVEVRELHLASHEMVEHVKELEASKTYEADISFEHPIDEADLEAAVAQLEGATIEQRTPTRVAHRRADKTRTRSVHTAAVVSADETTARIRIHGDGGLYIKELLHGDEGRTEPSLADLLGCDVTVDALDVVDVEAAGDTPFDRDDYLE